MSDQPTSSTKRDRVWATLWVAASVSGIAFSLQAVPLLFGDKERSWLGTLLGMPFSAVIAGIIFWITAPSITIRHTKWPTNVAGSPVVIALKGGAVTAVALFILGLLMYATLLPAEVRLPAAISLAFAQGVWVTFMSYLAIKFAGKKLVESGAVLRVEG
jgi:hypothetical protein